MARRMYFVLYIISPGLFTILEKSQAVLNIRSVCICTCDILDGFMYKCKHLVLSCLPMWLCLVKYTYYSPLRNYLPFTSPNNIVSHFHWNFKIVSRLCYLWILFQVGKGVLLQHNKHKVIGLAPHKFIHSSFHGQWSSTPSAGSSAQDLERLK